MENSKGACPVQRSAQAESRTSVVGTSFKSSLSSASFPPNIRNEEFPVFPVPPISATPSAQDRGPYSVCRLVNLPRLACSKLSVPRAPVMDIPRAHSRESTVKLFKGKRMVYMVCKDHYAMNASFLSVQRAMTSVVPSTPRVFKSSPARFSAKRPEVTPSPPHRRGKDALWK